MKARILPLDSDEHRIAQELLPWFVNGTLDAAEESQVKAHLAHCGRCQLDAASQAELSKATAGPGPGGDADRDWASLRSRLGAVPAAALPLAAARALPWWKQGVPLAIAAQAVVVLGLVVVLFGAWSRPEPYRALGSAESMPADAVAVFRADATEQQMREALRAGGARIVGGPTVTNAYLLRLGDPGPRALAHLRSQPGVLAVESLQGEARP